MKKLKSGLILIGFNFGWIRIEEWMKGEVINKERKIRIVYVEFEFIVGDIDIDRILWGIG